MKSKFKKLLATALVLCLVLALLPAAAFADGVDLTVTYKNFEKQEIQASSEKGSVSIKKVDDEGTYTITATPGTNYGLKAIKVVDTDDTALLDKRPFFKADSISYDFTATSGSSITVYVGFAELYTVTYNQNDVTVSDTTFMKDEWVTVTPVNKAGSTLDNVWYRCGDQEVTIEADSEGNYKFQMGTSDVTVGADFSPFPSPTTDHSIITASGITGGTLYSDKAMASDNETVTITATPYNGYKTVSVYYMANNYPYGIKEVATPIGNNKWTFEMPDYDVVVSARFEYDPYYPGTGYHYITVSNPGNHCSVSVPSGAYCGQNVEITLSNFDTGYAFSYLKVNGEFVKPYGYNGYLSATFTMPHNNVAIEVGTTSVSGKYYIDTSYDSTLGGVEVWVNNNYVGNNWHQGSWADYNDTVSFKVKPYYSDDVVSVSVVGKRTGLTYSCDYSSYSGWYTFTMPNEDVTINVDFRSGVHKVYVDKVTDGKLTVSDDWAKYGQIVYITAVPDYGCTLSSLSVRTATGDSVRVYNAQKADTYYFYMPDQYVSVSAVFTGKYTSLPFNDVSYGDWYYDAVQFVYSKGIMDGVDYYKFAPNGTITRGMILTMLWRMAGEPFEMPVTSFTDVEIGRYYTTAVAWACRNGIADGMGESTFGPNDAITREELVTLLYRYAQYFGHSCIGTSIEGFADAGSVSSYAYNAMCWAYKAGVVTGTTGSRLNPQGTASRAEAAQMIMSFYSFLNS